MSNVESRILGLVGLALFLTWGACIAYCATLPTDEEALMFILSTDGVDGSMGLGNSIATIVYFFVAWPLAGIGLLVASGGRRVN